MPCDWPALTSDSNRGSFGGGSWAMGSVRPLDPPSEHLFTVPGSSFHKLRGYKGNFQMANQNEGSQFLWTVESDFLEGEI